MDILTTVIITAAILVVAARMIELAVVRPDAIAKMFAGARTFAETAVAESAALRKRVAPIGPPVADNDAVADRPALAA